MTSNKDTSNFFYKDSEAPRKAICRVCGVSHLIRKMICVPSDFDELEKWKKSFGSEFAANIKLFKTNYICFNDYWRLEMESLEEDSRTLVDGGIEQENMTKKQTVRDFLLMKKQNKLMARNKKVTKKAKKAKKANKSTRTAVCRVCGTSHPSVEMKRVTIDREKLEHWKIMLGQPFVRNISWFKCNYICYSHYLLLQEKSEEIDYEKEAEQMENVEEDESETIIEEENASSSIETEEQTETEEFDDEIMELVPWDSKTNIRKLHLKREPIPSNNEVPTPCVTEVVPQEQPFSRYVTPKREPSPDIEVIEHRNPNVGFANPSNENIQCRACNGHFNKILMTETPSDPEEMKKWIDILGSGFLGNIMNNPPPYFICYTHLREIVKGLCQKK